VKLDTAANEMLLIITAINNNNVRHSVVSTTQCHIWIGLAVEV